MQDKRLGPFRAKPLSAHLFFWPTPRMRWATERVESPLAPENTAGPNGELGVFTYREALYG